MPKNRNLSTRISKLVASMRPDIMFSLQYLEQVFTGEKVLATTFCSLATRNCYLVVRWLP